MKSSRATVGMPVSLVTALPALCRLSERDGPACRNGPYLAGQMCNVELAVADALLKNGIQEWKIVPY